MKIKTKRSKNRRLEEIKIKTRKELRPKLKKWSSSSEEIKTKTRRYD